MVERWACKAPRRRYVASERGVRRARAPDAVVSRIEEVGVSVSRSVVVSSSSSAAAGLPAIGSEACAGEEEGRRSIDVG